VTPESTNYDTDITVNATAAADQQYRPKSGVTYGRGAGSTLTIGAVGRLLSNIETIHEQRACHLLGTAGSARLPQPPPLDPVWVIKAAALGNPLLVEGPRLR
jgi:hypothetical protein